MTAPVASVESAIGQGERAPGERTLAEGAADEELLREHIAGDPLALHTLLARHEVRMHWAERAAGVAEHDLADVHQEAILRIHRRASTFAHRSSVMTWMVTIARRTALNFITTQQRRARHHAQDITDCEYQLPSAAFHQHDRELAVDLYNALNSIPIRFRQTVVLRGLMGYSIAEISDMLDVAPGTVKSRYSRGRHLLQRTLVLSDYASRG